MDEANYSNGTLTRAKHHTVLNNGSRPVMIEFGEGRDYQRFALVDMPDSHLNRRRNLEDEESPERDANVDRLIVLWNAFAGIPTAQVVAIAQRIRAEVEQPA